MEPAGDAADIAAATDLVKQGAVASNGAAADAGAEGPGKAAGATGAGGAGIAIHERTAYGKKPTTRRWPRAAPAIEKKVWV